MSRKKGNDAEQYAADFLRQQGLQLLVQNYYCRRGEIDIIAEDGAVLVFVEVRQRRFLSAAAVSIDIHKQKRIIAAAAHYMSGGRMRPCRFDVILIDQQQKMQWLKAAFDAG